MKLGIVGSRGFVGQNAYNTLENIILSSFNVDNIHLIVSGGAKGTDTLAENFAKEQNIDTVIHLAKWEKYGIKAGFIRNELIWEDSDIVVAFWDGTSKGTKHSFTLSEKYNKPFLVVEYLINKKYWYKPERFNTDWE